MISQIIKIILGVLAVLLTGLVSAVIGFIVGSNIFIIFGLEFNGRQGYEAGGPIGFILGAKKDSLALFTWLITSQAFLSGLLFQPSEMFEAVGLPAKGG